MRTLIERVERIVESARESCRFGRKSAAVELQVVAADKGFCPAAEEYALLEKRIDTLAIPRQCGISATR